MSRACVLGQYKVVLDSMGSVYSGNWYLVILSQFRALLDSTCLYWVSIGLYWLVLVSRGPFCLYAFYIMKEMEIC